MNQIEVCLVGTGAVRVNLERGGPAFVVTAGDERILVDCGRNTVHNLTRAGYTVESINKVFVTHLHFDHVCDLAYFVLLSWNNGRKERIRFFGPQGLADFLDYALLKTYEQDIKSRLGHGKDPLGIEWSVTEIEADGEFHSGGDLVCSALFTEHGNMPNLNFRFDLGDKRVVITSDTSADPRLTPFCRDADLLVSECSGPKSFLDERPWGTWHMWPETVAALCREAGVKRVALKHLVVEDWTDDREISAKMAAAVRAAFDGEVILGPDGLKIQV